MALPSSPESGLFPDTLVEPFIAAPELEDLADDVIASFDEFEPIQTAIRDEGLTIAYVWETKPFDPLKDEFKPHTIAKVTKASPLWRCIAELHLVIQFRLPFWGAFNDAQRRAVLHHELTHIKVATDAQGRLKLGLREHDVEDFARTMRRFGPIIPGRASFVKAYLDWQHEQDQPEPTPLRPVAIEEAMAAAIDDAAVGGPLTADLRAVAERRGLDIKITHGGRSATIKGKGGKTKPATEAGVRCPSPGCIRWADHAGDHDTGGTFDHGDVEP